MAWTAPMTASASTALTAANWNLQIRDNLNETTPAKTPAVSYYCVTTAANALANRYITRNSVSNEQTTTSTTYANLATPGPSITVTTGTVCMVMVQCLGSNSGATNTWRAAYEITGATTVSASDDWAVMGSGTDNFHATAHKMHTGLTAGNNTFNLKYRVNAGTGTFRYRRILVQPL